MNISKKTLLTVAFSAFIAVFAAGCQGPLEKTTTIGYFKSERVDKEAEQIKAIEDEAQKKMREMQDEFLATLQSRPEMTQEEFQQFQQEQMAKAQSYTQSYQMQIRQKLDVALDAICREKKIDIVMENNAIHRNVLMGGVDLTDDLIEKLKIKEQKQETATQTSEQAEPQGSDAKPAEQGKEQK